MEANQITSDEFSIQEAIPDSVVRQKSSRKRRIAIFIIVSLLNVALLAVLWVQLLTPASSLPASTDTNVESGLGDISSPLIGKSAPDFTLPTLSGSGNAGKIRLADFKGKPVVLNFWASWCEPCNDEAAFLQKSWPSLQSQGIVFLGIDGPEKSSDALKFLQKYGITYRNAQDTIDGAVAINYGVTGFPETVFIDRNGVVVAKWAKPLTDQGLKLELAKLAH